MCKDLKERIDMNSGLKKITNFLYSIRIPLYIIAIYGCYSVVEKIFPDFVNGSYIQKTVNRTRDLFSSPLYILLFVITLLFLSEYCGNTKLIKTLISKIKNCR